MTIHPGPNWTKAMQRAIDQGLKATKTVDGTYRVRSVSKPGTFHTVILDDAGHILHCSDCKGWERGGRQHPCKHAGAVALARAYLSGASIAPRRVDDVVAVRQGRRQLYREEVAV